MLSKARKDKMLPENQSSGPLAGQWGGRQSTCTSLCELQLPGSGTPNHRLPGTSGCSLGPACMNPPSHSDMPLFSFAPPSSGSALVSLCTEPGSEVAIFCARTQLMHHLAFRRTCYLLLFSGQSSLDKNYMYTPQTAICMCTLSSLENIGQLESK